MSHTIKVLCEKVVQSTFKTSHDYTIRARDFYNLDRSIAAGLFKTRYDITYIYILL